jgi:5-methyltetrahydrofolate--homocysteine methyltransferase
MAATLGTKIEREIRMAQVSDMTKTIILDCCASTAIEQVCDKVQEDIEAEVKASGGFITSRYSPGYGDMPIEQQKDFVALLDTHRKIGLTATKNNILTPRKSVTAVIGISKTMIKNTKRDCETCNFKDKCMYRKEGRSCEN